MTQAHGRTRSVEVRECLNCCGPCNGVIPLDCRVRQQHVAIAQHENRIDGRKVARNWTDVASSVIFSMLLDERDDVSFIDGPVPVVNRWKTQRIVGAFSEGFRTTTQKHTIITGELTPVREKLVSNRLHEDTLHTPRVRRWPHRPDNGVQLAIFLLNQFFCHLHRDPLRPYRAPERKQAEYMKRGQHVPITKHEHRAR